MKSSIQEIEEENGQSMSAYLPQYVKSEACILWKSYMGADNNKMNQQVRLVWSAILRKRRERNKAKEKRQEQKDMFISRLYHGYDSDGVGICT